MFRVWSTPSAASDERLLFGGFEFELTERARSARDSYDVPGDPSMDACERRGMPAIMAQPHAIELLRGDGVIHLRLAEGDTLRTIDMTPGAAPGSEPRLLGNSVGRWEGDTLAVMTMGSSWPYTDMTGIPNNEFSVMVERFTVSGDGQRLNYTMKITNPAIFSEPPTFTRSWLWIPGASVDPHECEPDITH